MQDQPADIGASALQRVLAKWGIDVVSLTYAPVGFGDHHWTAADAGSRRWFVTVADLPSKAPYGRDGEAARRALRGAMDTAVSLRGDSGLDFVVAPVRAAGGDTVVPLGDRYAVSVFPFVDGTSGEFGQELAGRERDSILEVLAELHRAAPPASARIVAPDLSARGPLEETLRRLGDVWQGGPYAEPARALMRDGLRAFRRRLEEFDRRAGELAGLELVVTHGEPHPGNVVRLDGRPLLVDWDTVGLAPPERDLWLVAAEPDDLAWYAEVSGRSPDPSALAFYRLRWALEDLADFVEWFRSPHGSTPDAEQAWKGLSGTMEWLTGGA
ncbi:hypothetical protein Pth03_34550 [Planotetraspora thailandica]|uniref:Aminoglycoside phosphotransferase domain-containing protein n=1 Tax=Planotetraspora thailandica TaxID=487172 RepID=A0A8J3V4Y1_9ACTN|nr:phosphotransferase [Planotetraspora thailandica]GII55066.1 hypothetical protein Pth03_34550 [Planotetraspora thailandica]